MVVLRLRPVFCSKFPTNLFEGLSGEASDGVVLNGIADLDRVAVDFTVFDVPFKMAKGPTYQWLDVAKVSPFYLSERGLEMILFIPLIL